MSTAKSQILGWVAYPGAMVSAFLVYALLDTRGVSVVASSYIAVMFGAAAVTALEFIIPYDRSWQPNLQDVKSDLFFMVTVQMVLPQILTLLAGVGLVRYLRTLDWPVTLWPHILPLAAQVAVMLLIAEFFRYWLHLAAHNTSVLWRFHAVHHSPQKLYWLNVGRFHPIEKALQYMLDMLPFILVGVSEPVLALYYVILRRQRFLPALERRRQVWGVELRREWRGVAPVAPLEAHRGVQP